jgi:hypothetical protein
VSPAQARIDGEEMPILIGSPGLDPAPPILSGDPVREANQIVLGGQTLQQLHKHVGDSVTLGYGAPQDAPIYVPPTRMKIVGVATFPAIGYPSDVSDHTSMGTGALVSTDVEPPALRRAERAPDPLLNGPSMVLVWLRPGITEAGGLANMQRVVKTTNAVLTADQNAGGDSLSVLGVQRPAEIVNYQTMGLTPEILAARPGLAEGARVHPPAAFRRGRLSGVGGGGGGRRRRGPAHRHRARSPVVDPVRPRHQRGARADGPGARGGLGRGRDDRARQHRGRRSRPHRRPHAHLGQLAGRLIGAAGRKGSITVAPCQAPGKPLTPRPNRGLLS